MLDLKNSKTKMIEELYLSIQLMIGLTGVIIVSHLDKSIFSVHTKFLLWIYLLYSITCVTHFIRKVYFKNILSIDPNIYLAFLDGIFITLFLYLSPQNFYAIFHFFYIYIALESIRFYDKSSSIFSTFISICYSLIVVLENPRNLISFEFLIHVGSFYLLSYILSSVIHEIHQLENQVHFMFEEIKTKNNMLKEIASRDYLTKLYNHKSFYEFFQKIIKTTKMNHTPFCLTIIDIDDFKKVNDTYGHVVGDMILKEISLIIQSNTRKTDIAARYGGEEFAILFPNTSIRESQKICERIRKSIENHIFFIHNHKIQITISGGLGSAIISSISAKGVFFIEFVDKLLYEAKRFGKNQIRSSSQIIFIED
ncbi:GGDEF domain-containing protein [Inediibacterium massiliense]|uniref:GGDEF domain-containing protein n=1 Tax=Inediibacterium massiliense TaxID=1658111 RepID=UPI0006B67033|nr:GGDEF domain-containing protein [Inediibacterium massiliense]